MAPPVRARRSRVRLHLRDFADLAGIEFLLIDAATRLTELVKELRWNEMYYHLARGL